LPAGAWSDVHRALEFAEERGYGVAQRLAGFPEHAPDAVHRFEFGREALHLQSRVW